MNQAKTGFIKGDNFFPERRVRKKYKFRFKFNIITLMIIFFVGSVVYNIFIGLFGLAVNYYRLAEQTKLLNEKVRMKAALEAEKKRWQEDDLLEEEARKLGMVKEGELKDLFDRLVKKTAKE